MRLTRYHLYLLVGLVLAIVGPAVFSQPDPSQFGGRGKGGFGKGGMGKGFDPDTFWNMLAPGKETFDINNVQLPFFMQRNADRTREQWSIFLQSKGINVGIMTKALFQEYQQEAMAKRAGGFGPGGMGKGGKRGMDPNAPPADPKAEDAEIEKEGKQYFTSLDRNKDNFIDREEAKGSWLELQFQQYDTNKDGKLSLDEYLEAYRDSQARRGRGSRAAAEGGGAIIQQEEEIPEEDKRPVVYRAEGASQMVRRV